MSNDDFDFEPIPGLPATPPAGEDILWQGAPSWRTVATRVFHADKVAIYFAALMVWRFAAVQFDGFGGYEAGLSAFRILPFGIVAVGLLLLLAWGTGRSTVYTVTSKRVVMRYGMALPLTVNLPFAKIAAADLKAHSDGTGDIALEMVGKDGFGFAVLWPHVKPFQFAKPQPMLRCIPQPDKVAGLLASALGASTVASSSKTPESKAVGWPKFRIAR